jgi:formate hydrogenlyase subunit 4
MTSGELFLLTVLGGIGITFFGIFFGLLYKGIDRKIAAHMQKRVGPPIRQPFRDVGKLLYKENVVPENAVPWLFNLAPVVCLAASITILLYIPLGGFKPLLHGEGDLILVLYLLIIPALAMVIGGFASGSPYATIGAQREMVTMMSYEFPLAVTIISIVWRLSRIPGELGSDQPFFALSFISEHPIWGELGVLGVIGALILVLALVIVIPAELSKIPFDVAEAETEIAGGLLVEYSGRNLALFYIADGVKTFAVASLLVALFFPYTISDVLGVGSYAAEALDFFFFLAKVFLVMLFSVTLIRIGVARLRISQVVSTYWIAVTLIALLGLVLIMWDIDVLTINW